MSTKCSVIANCIVCLARTEQRAVYAPLDVAKSATTVAVLATNCTKLNSNIGTVQRLK